MLAVLARGEGVSSVVLPIAILLGFSTAVTFAATRIFTWDDA